MTFDATSREFCTVRRVRTNTPLQALTLLNDPASFEAAGALAKRMMEKSDARARAAFGIKLVLSRNASPAEIDRLLTTFEQELSHYGARGDRASAELAAWTIVANVLLNLDEAVTNE